MVVKYCLYHKKNALAKIYYIYRSLDIRRQTSCGVRDKSNTVDQLYQIKPCL